MNMIGVLIRLVSICGYNYKIYTEWGYMYKESICRKNLVRYLGFDSVCGASLIIEKPHERKTLKSIFKTTLYSLKKTETSLGLEFFIPNNIFKYKEMGRGENVVFTHFSFCNENKITHVDKIGGFIFLHNESSEEVVYERFGEAKQIYDVVTMRLIGLSSRIKAWPKYIIEKKIKEERTKLLTIKDICKFNNYKTHLLDLLFELKDQEKNDSPDFKNDSPDFKNDYPDFKNFMGKDSKVIKEKLEKIFLADYIKSSKISFEKAYDYVKNNTYLNNMMTYDILNMIAYMARVISPIKENVLYSRMNYPILNGLNFDKVTFRKGLYLSLKDEGGFGNIKRDHEIELTIYDPKGKIAERRIISYSGKPLFIESINFCYGYQIDMEILK
ncbi:hypothetical protein NGRA_0018 [Nosema granulosis]|uniref:Uncharacterized protein n=1 Tax=Nosema granulosis TaxID=83296 RepID=A0A9P6H168_9MICR|nr:hypothetical protein NGRA_0018 [Nosema granulosis]